MQNLLQASPSPRAGLLALHLVIERLIDASPDSDRVFTHGHASYAAIYILLYNGTLGNNRQIVWVT